MSAAATAEREREAQTGRAILEDQEPLEDGRDAGDSGGGDPPAPPPPPPRRKRFGRRKPPRWQLLLALFVGLLLSGLAGWYIGRFTTIFVRGLETPPEAED